MLSRRIEVHRLRWVLWVALLLTLPVTSFPYFPPIFGFRSVLVRPLALYPLIPLLSLDLLPYLFRGGRLPRIVLPLFAFSILALISTQAQLLDPPLPLRGQTPESRALRGILTLGIGLSFYLVATRMTMDRERLIASIRWLMVGGVVVVLWGAVQASRLLLSWPHYKALFSVQKWFSIRALHEQRVVGLAFEPSWFADQLIVLYLPVLWASIIEGFPLLTTRRWGRSVTIAMFGIAALDLGVTYSRGGILFFVFTAGVAGVLAMVRHRKRILAWLSGEDREAADRRRDPRLMFRRVGLILAGLIAGLGLAWEVFRQSPYFSLLWIRRDRLADLGDYLVSIGGGPRLALAQAAWQVFLRFPWLGVGLGQSGFFIFDHMPNWAYDERDEIAVLAAPNSPIFPNPKNLWVRLLAETGLGGALLFAVFLALMLIVVGRLIRREEMLARTVGLFGLMSWVAILLDGFSLDSFALPTPWISFGIISGAAVALRDSRRKTRPGKGEP